MPSSPSNWARLGLILLGARGSFGQPPAPGPPPPPGGNGPPVPGPPVPGPPHRPQTVTDTATVVPETKYVHVTVPVYVNVTSTHYTDVYETSTLLETCTESTTTTLCFTENVTTTLYFTKDITTTIICTENTTTTFHFTVSETETDSTTITDSTTVTDTDTATTTDTVPATVTTYTTETIFSTTFNPCPTTCSISAGTVNLFFWPTNRPYTYPPTYVDTALGYTFTSPSVYMLIPTAVGVNSVSARVGPSTTDWILPLDLDEVSTIYDGSITRQLTIADLGTNCPQTADPTAIATLVDPACDPILAAPKQVSSWAYPCNACGRFGLFDPPYAVPTLPGGLVPTTAAPPPVTVTAAPPPPSSPPVGTLLVVYLFDGKVMSTATMPTTGVSGTVTSTVALSDTSTAAAVAATTTSAEAITTASLSSPATVPSSSVSMVVTAAAPKMTGGLEWLACLAIAVLMI